MRISTSSLYETGTNQLGTLQSQLAKTQQQLSTTRRILTPADDPVAAARVLDVTQSQSINSQLAINRQSARSSLSHEGQALSSATTLLQDMQVLAISAGNGALTQTDRNALAVELSGRLDDLMGVANTADGEGGYVFSGYKLTSTPYLQTASGADYHGDQGQRQLQVGSSRQMAISDPGSAVFESGLTGNGTFATAAASSNVGSGVISAGIVTDARLLTGDKYQIDFANAGTPPTLSYTITNTITGLAVPPPPAVATAVPYQSGQQIAFDGIAFDVKGGPADGDKFTVAPSQKQSVFKTVTDLIATLRSPVSGPGAQAALTSGLASAGGNLTAALDNVLSVQSSVGARMKELDYLDSAGDDTDIQYASTLSQLQDLDMAKTISLFTQQQFTLQAAQKSFQAMSGLSLFNYIS
jgi:flagellar hook-associated protein 3 FlgL